MVYGCNYTVVWPRGERTEIGRTQHFARSSCDLQSGQPKCFPESAVLRVARVTFGRQCHRFQFWSLDFMYAWRSSLPFAKLFRKRLLRELASIDHPGGRPAIDLLLNERGVEDFLYDLLLCKRRELDILLDIPVPSAEEVPGARVSREADGRGDDRDDIPPSILGD
jgi:hypothetical protein